MNSQSSLALIAQAILDFGASALVILGAIIILILSFLVFRWGWRELRRMAFWEYGVGSYPGDYRNLWGGKDQ